MTYRTRTILFVGLAAIFLVVAPLTVLYCLGWRFDWETKKIVQPGAFYFKIWPRNSQVYLDGKLKKKTDLFFGSVLIENLSPREYDVEIKKEGFHSWKKKLEVKKREVTEAKNIVLIPENPKFNLLNKNTKDFFFSPDAKKIILKEENDEGWALKLFEIDKNVKSHLIEERDISKEEVELFDIKFSPDSTKILLKVGFKERLTYYLLDIDKVLATLTPLGLLEWPEEAFLPAVRELKNVIALTVVDEDIYYLDSSGFLFKNQERLNLIPFEVKKETKYKITVRDPNILLEENDILYIFEENKKSFQKLFEPIENFKFSPDTQKLAYANNYEIWVLFLDKKYNQPQREAGQKLFITRFSEKIDNLFWYTNHYLIFNLGDKIKIVEIDNRDKINIVDLAELPAPEIFWSNKKLYLLSEENFYVSEKLSP